MLLIDQIGYDSGVWDSAELRDNVLGEGAKAVLEHAG